MKKKEVLVKQTGVITALLSGAVASCLLGSPLVATVIGGVLTNILSNKVEQSDLLKIQEILSSRNPANLNHDLEQLVKEAMEWATKNIGFTYEAYCIHPSQKKLLTQTIAEIVKDLRQIDQSNWKASNELLNEIDDTVAESHLIRGLIVDHAKWPEINATFPFPKFYEDHFVANFKLCFGELLKDPRQASARLAYQRNISSQLQSSLKMQGQKIDALLKSNEAIKEQLAVMARSPIESFEQTFIAPNIQISLDHHLDGLRNEVNLLIDSNGKILTGIADIQKESRHQTQQIGQLSKQVRVLSKSRIVYVIALPLLAVLLAFLSYQYWWSQQAFTFVVNVSNASSNTALPFDEPVVNIQFRDKTEQKATQNGSIVFGGLPAFLRKDSIRVQVKNYGFHYLDTTVIRLTNLSLTLHRDDTYRWLKGRVKDANTGTPLSQAKVSAAETSTYTDQDGKFLLDFSEATQKTEQRLIVSKPGYQPWERIEPVISNSESIIQLKTQ
ncbi:MAG: carboxypeptidase regulatory-like domain-containing protein [Bacteroidota bacterium]